MHTIRQPFVNQVNRARYGTCRAAISTIVSPVSHFCSPQHLPAEQPAEVGTRLAKPNCNSWRLDCTLTSRCLAHRVRRRLLQQHDIVLEKDLGPNTAALAGPIAAFYKDGAWEPRM